MKHDIDNSATYDTLRAIEQRKAQLLKEIRKDSNDITKLRRRLFEKPAPTRSNALMPSNLVSTGASVLDGLLLAWKLYRKFKKR